MEFDANTLLAGLLVSSIGFVLLAYGKRMGRPPQVIAGIVLLVYPYFVSGAVVTLSIAAGVILLFSLALKLGW